jgi:hypothetical protein
VLTGHANSRSPSSCLLRIGSVLPLLRCSLSAITSSPGAAKNSANVGSRSLADGASSASLSPSTVRGSELASVDFQVRLTCFTQLLNALESRAFIIMHLKKGRRVARHPAMMLAPHSMVDQVEMLVALQKKSSVSVRPST